jgi:anti-sigma-K factor RskA
MNDDIHSLSGAYAVDAVDADERARFEEHLAVCAQCRAEVEGLRSAATQLAGLSEAVPPPRLRSAVLRDIASVRPLPPPGEPGAPEGRPAGTVESLEDRRAGRARVGRWLLGAAAAALLAVGALWHPWLTPSPPAQDPTQQVLQAADAQRFAHTLDGARATIVRSPRLGRAVIIADNMPAAPPGHVYEVWLQHKDGRMVKAGLMPQGSHKQVSLVLEGDAAQAVGAGITVEPDGGSNQPTTTPLLLFSFA